MRAQAKRRFPLELEAHTEGELQTHMKEHPECQFCSIHLYGSDELYHHMRAEHFTCDLCQRQGAFRHFVSASDLIDHLRYGTMRNDRRALALDRACQDDSDHGLIISSVAAISKRHLWDLISRWTESLSQPI
jgi:hypothetical protein